MLGIVSTHISADAGGQLIKVARTRAALSQTQLARRMGVAQQTISRWERRQQGPTFEHVLQAVGACGWDLISALVLHDEIDSELRKPMKLRVAPPPRAAVVELLGIDAQHGGERRMQGMTMMRKRRSELRARSEQRNSPIRGN